VKKAATVLSTESVDKKKPRGHKSTHGVAKKEIAEALGVSTSTVVRAEQHTEAVGTRN
jgi:DNA-binding XRE family transcriptional regulator